MDSTFISILTGTDCWGPDGIKNAVAARAAILIPKIPQQHPNGYDACYDGNRCKPENLGWRFQQNARPFLGGPSVDLIGREEITPEGILAGIYDDLIVYTYHDAASAEHYYRFEKDWG